jgi:hypothetical protein
VFVLDEGDDSHLCFALGALKGVDLLDALDARGPTAFTELLPIVALWFFRRRRGKFGSFTAAPTRIRIGTRYFEHQV